MKHLFVITLVLLSFFVARGQSIAYKREEHKVVIINGSDFVIKEVYVSFGNGDFSDDALGKSVEGIKPKGALGIKTFYVTSYNFKFKSGVNQQCTVAKVYMDKNYIIYLNNEGCNVTTEEEFINYVKRKPAGDRIY